MYNFSLPVSIFCHNIRSSYSVIIFGVYHIRCLSYSVISHLKGILIYIFFIPIFLPPTFFLSHFFLPRLFLPHFFRPPLFFTPTFFHPTFFPPLFYPNLFLFNFCFILKGLFIFICFSISDPKIKGIPVFWSPPDFFRI